LFLESRPDDGRPADVLIHGVPYDGSVSYRSGAAAGPIEVRHASDSIESYSPRTGRDLGDIDFADAGDLDVTGLEGARLMDRIAQTTEALTRRGRLVVTFGGDHSVSIGTARGLRAAHADLVHVVYDAHMDMRASYDGTEFSHACTTRHLSLTGSTWLLGVRSGTREEYADADGMLTGWSDRVDLPPGARESISGRPVFVSVDLDVLDPSILPGTGTPEPAGASYRDLRESLLGLAGLRVVGIDFLELAPALDPSGLSAVVAAELARESILGLLTP